ncbi:hypothetical protein C806_02615 [Lachnospiraceae bacterium 3-1]|nr:hypothetical protein C806_02615 [Lachnospiraceae bacterium 3-1]
MKKRRKTISFLLTLSLALGLCWSVPFDWQQPAKIQAAELPTPTGDTSGTCGAQGDNIKWELILDPDGTIYPDENDTVSSDSPVCYELHLTGTGEMNQLLFSSTKSPWYNYRKHITSLTISEGITSICDFAFWEHCSLPAVTLPDSVASIGISAFLNAYSLKTITCGAGLTRIEDNAFWNLFSLTEIHFNEGLEEIGTNAFYNCSALESISLPRSLVSIKADAFSNLLSLTEIHFNEGLKEIGPRAFLNCSKLEHISLPESLVSIKANAFLGLPSLADVELKEGLQEIGPYAFSECSALTNISLPRSLKSLNAKAFYHTPLTSITIPENVEEIQPGVFGKTPLKTIQVADGNPYFFVQDNILYEKSEDGAPKRAIAYAIADPAASVTLLPGTELIDQHTFHYAQNLTSIQLPDTLTKIGDSAFDQAGLMELNLPDSVKNIGMYAFRYCGNIQSLNLPDSVESIEQSAFSCGSALKTVTIGKGLRNADAIFNGNINLETITVSPENPYLKSLENVVYSEGGTRLSYYAPLKPNRSYHVPEQVKSIAEHSITDAVSLEKLYLPAALEKLDGYSIFNNQKLNSIYFSGNASDIQTDAASISANSSELILYKTADSTGWNLPPWTSYRLADWDPANTDEGSGSFGALSWEYIGSDGSLIFTGSGQIPDFTEDSPAPWSSYVASIQTIKGDGITSIGDYSFSNASKLIYLGTGASLERIGSHAFANCSKLKSLNISAITDIGNAAFRNNTSITGSLILEKVSSIGEGAFQGCTGITSATLGSKLGILEKEAFAGCTSLASFIIPDSTYEIRDGALRGCVSLRSINIPSDVYHIGTQAFAGNTALERAYFGGTIPGRWASDSFENCSSHLHLCHRAAQTSWNRLNGNWNGIPLLRQERFYTEGQDHYSFANNADSFGYPDGYRFLKRRFVETLGNISLGTYYYVTDNGWKGSCYGMAGTTLEFYENPNFHATDYGAPYNTLSTIQAPRSKDASITKLIESYQISQYHPIISGSKGSISRHWNNYQGLVQKVEEFERSGGLRLDAQAEPVVLLLYSIYDGHAVIPISVMQTKEGDFQIKAYNPDHPSQLEILTIRKDFGKIKGYSGISYVPYSDLTASLSGVETYSQEIPSLYLSIDKEYGKVTDTEGREISEMEGAYEQKPLSSQRNNSFCGIKRFVLPEGNYQLTTEVPKEKSESSNPDSVSFYLGTEKYFAKITSSDENAVLNITETGTEDGSLTMELLSESQTKETASFTLVNNQGMERTVEIGSSNATVAIKENNNIAIQAPGQDSVLLDGQNTILQDGQTASSFIATEQENPLKASLLEKEVSCDNKNKLSGNLQTEIISNAAANKKVTITAEFVEKDKTAAIYTQNDTLAPGLNHVFLTFDQLKSTFQQTEGTLALSLKLTVTDEAGNAAVFTTDGISVTLTKQPDSNKEESNNNGADNSDGKKPGNNNSNSNKPSIEKPGSSSSTVQKPKVTAIRTNVKRLTLGLGESYTLKAKALPANASNKKLRYTASNKRIAVSSTGKITTKKTGSSKITIRSSNGKTATVQVTVKKKPGKINLNAKTKTIKVGWKFQLKVKLPKGTASHKLTYSSNKKSVATVSSTGKITARKKGTAIITVKTYNGKKAKIKIIVKKK